MRWKNITDDVLLFRAHNKEGIKERFRLKSGEEFESDRPVSHGGLELVKQEKKVEPKKTKKEMI